MKRYDWLKEANKELLIAFDVDGTLINFDDTPRYDIIELLYSFHWAGCKVMVWSGGGKDYAQHWCDKLGLSPNIISSKFQPLYQEEDYKPDIAFDDEVISLGKVNICV